MKGSHMAVEVGWRVQSSGESIPRDGGSEKEVTGVLSPRGRDREAQRCAQAKGEGDRERGRSQAAPSPEG